MRKLADWLFTRRKGFWRSNDQQKPYRAFYAVRRGKTIGLVTIG